MIQTICRAFVQNGEVRVSTHKLDSFQDLGVLRKKRPDNFTGAYYKVFLYIKDQIDTRLEVST